MTPPAAIDWLALPKAELHVHLEGSILPETLLELARRNSVELPAPDAAGLREWFVFRDFDHFIRVYITVTRCLRRAADYELAVFEFGREMARQNIRYAEATFSPGTHSWLGVPEDEYLSGLALGRARAREAFGVEINWIFDIVRNAERADYYADLTLRLALDGRASGVVALGLGGKEAGHPPERFARWFERAKSEGLKSSPHAGETAGPESVRAAVESLAADRIGHGVRAIEDPALVRLLAERRIPLEVCPTSNIRLGVYPDLASHPLRRLHDAGVIVTINSDDPPLFNTTLTDEMALLSSSFGFSPAASREILFNAPRHSFAPPASRADLEVELAPK